MILYNDNIVCYHALSATSYVSHVRTKTDTTVAIPADTLLPILTVEEMLLYTAELKRPLSEPLEQKKAAVQELLEKLALTDCR